MKPPLGLALGHIEKEQSVENQICTKWVKFSDIAGVCPLSRAHQQLQWLQLERSTKVQVQNITSNYHELETINCQLCDSQAPTRGFYHELEIINCQFCDSQAPTRGYQS
jgi:hypothetical protein